MLLRLGFTIRTFGFFLFDRWTRNRSPSHSAAENSSKLSAIRSYRIKGINKGAGKHARIRQTGRHVPALSFPPRWRWSVRYCHFVCTFVPVTLFAEIAPANSIVESIKAAPAVLDYISPPAGSCVADQIQLGILCSCACATYSVITLNYYWRYVD